MESDALVLSLNALLVNLHIPFVLESPQDLTPALLLLILEYILGSRLPITAAVRESRSPAAKIDAMKIFIGVLEDDIIQMDVGLGEVDPRKLATGGWDEVVFVGELLCWLAKQKGILVDDDANAEPKERQRSPSTQSAMTATVNTVLSNESTVVTDIAHDHDVSPRAQSHDSLGDTRRVRRPRCIHETFEPEFLDGDTSYSSTASTSYCQCPEPYPSPPPVRYSGWIDRVDDDREVRSFEERKKNSTSQKSVSPESPSYHGLTPGRGRRPYNQTVGRSRIVTRHNSPTQHTLALLDERARLLTELAKLKMRDV